MFEFEVPSCRTCSLRSKKANLEDGTSNLKKMTRPCAKLGSLHADLTPPIFYILIVDMLYCIFDLI